MKDINTELAMNNFTLLVAHTMGIDHAGHYYRNVGHQDMERKILDAEEIIKQIID
jgi:hypothetical protein